MFDNFLKSMLPRFVQDIVQGLAGFLALHGYITNDQKTGFIGSAFFLIMLAVNYFIAMRRKSNSIAAGAASVVQVLPVDQQLPTLSASTLSPVQMTAVLNKVMSNATRPAENHSQGVS